jgi:hypothetical protein
VPVGLIAFASLALADLVASIVAQTNPELDLLDRVSELDTPALLVLFIVLLARGKIRWERELLVERAEKELWRAAAVGKAAEAERHVSIAEAAMRAGSRAK